MIEYEVSGSFENTEAFLKRISKDDIYKALDGYGRAGVAALSSATPADTGQTSTSWGYEVSKTRDTYSITWTNSHIVNGIPIAVILQYGHATGTGGYVQGRNYINPAIAPIFDKIAADVWKAVTSA